MMKLNSRCLDILERAQAGFAPTRDECVSLLQFPETSPEAAFQRAAADALMRQRFGNEAIILGQVGIDISPCPGDCAFCSFAVSHTRFESTSMTLDEIHAAADAFTRGGALYALFLMGMHDFDFSRLLKVVASVRERMPQQPQIVVNIGDFDRQQAAELCAAGVNGAYHVVRLREGVDTALDPRQRLETIRVIKESGMDWYYCCEPVGPEHSPEELADQLMIGVEMGAFQHAAMRRVYLADSPLARYGQITELRLAQITAVVALASLACADTRNIAVHEPNLIGLTSGANVIYAERGANPRDLETETSGHRGRDIDACKTMLAEAGFTSLLVAPEKKLPLSVM